MARRSEGPLISSAQIWCPNFSRSDGVWAEFIAVQTGAFRVSQRCKTNKSAIGVGTKVSFAPPSEPDWQVSCIRLSSWWLTFKKIGKPQRILVLRRTSQPRRSSYLAIDIDRYL